MYVFTQRLFPVPYEWGRLLRVVLAVAAIVGAAELLVPTEGAGGLLLRAALLALYPLTLWATGFFSEEERRWLGYLREPRALLASLRAEPAVDGHIPETYEVERMDEDLRT